MCLHIIVGGIVEEIRIVGERVRQATQADRHRYGQQPLVVICNAHHNISTPVERIPPAQRILLVTIATRSAFMNFSTWCIVSTSADVVVAVADIAIVVVVVVAVVVVVVPGANDGGSCTIKHTIPIKYAHAKRRDLEERATMHVGAGRGITGGRCRDVAAATAVDWHGQNSTRFWCRADSSGAMAHRPSRGNRTAAASSRIA